MADVDIQKKISIFLKSALENYFVNDYNDAIRDLKSAEVIDRDNHEILYNLGICYSRLGLYVTAAAYFERILSLPMGVVDVLTVRKLFSYALIQTGDFLKAGDVLNRVLNSVPADITALSMKGYCLQKQGLFSQAIDVYRLIVSYDKTDLNACNSLAYILAENNTNLDEALELAVLVNNSVPGSPSYLDTLGFVYMKRGEYNAAKNFLKKASGLSPLSSDIIEHLKQLNSLHTG